MGATPFVVVARGRDVLSAFRSAREDALHEHGHGGYTGTIAEKHDVTYGGWHLDDEAAARRFAIVELNADDERSQQRWTKDGPAGAVRFGVDGWVFFGLARS